MDAAVSFDALLLEFLVLTTMQHALMLMMTICAIKSRIIVPHVRHCQAARAALRIRRTEQEYLSPHQVEK
eukprot:1410683-Amphidinium_carterae.1